MVQINNSRVINCALADADQRSVTQFTTTEPVTQFNITQSTSAEPVELGGLLLAPALLYGFYGGCAFAGVATTALVSYSIYSGHKQGGRGWKLVKHPGKSCVEWLTNVCQSSSRPVQSEGTGIEVTGAEGATEIEMTLLSEMSMQGSDHSIVFETDQVL
ncbi:MAG: hypothetical protein KAG53_01945 [Endozoicomonadaceae bacterium]|nr:hypothetical protein [Endozoicomonadaceae bacterium]